MHIDTQTRTHTHTHMISSYIAGSTEDELNTMAVFTNNLQEHTNEYRHTRTYTSGTEFKTVYTNMHYNVLVLLSLLVNAYVCIS